MQEVAALTVVDTHVRERVCSIRQQEEEIATVLSQVIAVFRMWIQTNFNRIRILNPVF